MNLQFLGATDTVTGSRYLLEHQGGKLLVDCGLFQGYKALRLRNWADLPFDPATLSGVVLTHAHIDHSGYLPRLMRLGFKGTVWCTAATFDLCKVLLQDSGHLMEEEAEFANRHKLSKHAPALPLFTRDDAVQCLKLFKPIPIDQPWQVLPGLTATLSPSGHLPGSSLVRLADGHRSVLFSGDLGRPNDLLMKPPVHPEPADYLLIESTYGDRVHDKSDPMPLLADIIKRTVKRGGAVIIPSFAVGRAQTLLHCIAQLGKQGAIPRMPVYLNSPMASQATQIYHDHAGELRLSAAEWADMADTAQVVETPDESRALNTRHGPMIIISASGMATGGRVLHHLKAFAPDRRNTILFVGYQAGGTRGAAMEAGASTIRIFGEDVPVKAEVARMDLLSAHADSGEIIDWLRCFKAAPRTTFITHGEPHAADSLRLKIERELGWNCHLPYYTERVALN